mgnify:CR=1|jgi:hypothetical protein
MKNKVVIVLGLLAFIFNGCTTLGQTINDPLHIIEDIENVTHFYPLGIVKEKLIWCEIHQDYEYIEILKSTDFISHRQTLVPLSFQSPNVLPNIEGGPKWESTPRERTKVQFELKIIPRNIKIVNRNKGIVI